MDKLLFPKSKRDNARERHIQYLIDEINEWYFKDAPGAFDSSFFESLENQWLERGRLSDKQYAALQSIYENWVNI